VSKLQSRASVLIQSEPKLECSPGRLSCPFIASVFESKKHSVAHLFKALFDAATYMDLRRLPELFCGFRREKGRGPTLYPVACAPQAWASATPFTLLEAALGLEFDAAHGEIRLRNPRLPAFLNEVVLRDLRLGASSVDLRVRRHGEDVSLEVLRTRGEIRVSIVLAH